MWIHSFDGVLGGNTILLLRHSSFSIVTIIDRPCDVRISDFDSVNISRRLFDVRLDVSIFDLSPVNYGCCKQDHSLLTCSAILNCNK